MALLVFISSWLITIINTRMFTSMYFLFFFRVSKGVRDIPGSFQSSTINVPSGQSFVYFGILLAAGVFFVFIAFTMFLPVMVLVPQKFAICFTIGCALIVASFFALKGPKNQLAHMISKEVFFFLFPWPMLVLVNESLTETFELCLIAWLKVVECFLSMRYLGSLLFLLIYRGSLSLWDLSVPW